MRKKKIDIVIEYYKQKTGEEPDNETTNMLNERINQMEKLEETKKLSIPKEQKIQAIKQTIDALIGDKK